MPPAESGAETVLLVDDDDGVRNLLRVLLEGSGYVVLAASCGEEAMELSSQHVGPIRLVVTDLAMPGMSGLDVVARITSARPEAKILCVSSYAHEETLRRGMPDAEVTYVQKPFTPLALLQKVRELLDTPNQ